MASVDRLPPELWCEIIASACVDGGFTGRSLALTSKFFYAQSLSDRFHSISIHSASQVAAFLEFLWLQPKGYHPRIKHLYLNICLEHPWSLSRIYSPMHQATTAGRGVCAMKDKMKFPTALAALLVAAAPHLSTLCVVTSDSPLGTLAIPCTFPKLEELSLKGTELVFNPSLPTSVFPALKRIHFISLGLSTAMETLSRTELPSLTHLRISNLVKFQMMCTLVEALRDIPHQGPPAPPSSNSLSRPRHIIVHSTRPAVAGWSGYHDSAWIAFTHSLRAFVQAQNQENDGLRVLLLLRPMGSGRWIHRMQCQWLDRMQGGCGCWVESEAEEAASEMK